MKYVEFKELKIQNFLSVGDTPVCVEFKKGLHIVTGINRDKEDRRNGVGKVQHWVPRVSILWNSVSNSTLVRKTRWAKYCR